MKSPARSRDARRRREHFDRYVTNLAILKRHPDIHLVPDLNDAFLCPLCYELFDREVLVAHDTLTLEHITPQVLGGSDDVSTLTCKRCNNQSGSKLESHLTRMVQYQDVVLGIPGSSADILYSLLPDREEPRHWLRATLEVGDDGVRRVLGLANCSSPAATTWVTEQLSAGIDHRIPDNIKGIPVRPLSLSPRCALVALLRIAYLYAFRVLGYAAIISEAMHRVRDQILRPSEATIRGQWQVDLPFRDELLGVNAVLSPERLRSFLVVFDLNTGRHVHRLGVFLPHPNDSDLRIYQEVPGVRVEDRPDFAIVHLKDDPGRLVDPAGAFEAYYGWPSEEGDAGV